MKDTNTEPMQYREKLHVEVPTCLMAEELRTEEIVRKVECYGGEDIE